MFDQLLLNVNQHILNPIIFLMIGFGTLVFVMGVVEYIFSADDEAKRTTGRSHMFWGIIGLFIMLSVFGIIGLIIDSLGLDTVEILQQ